MATKEFKYVIIGGGMSAAKAVEGILDQDENGQIFMVSKDSDAPYNRPPLSKDLWVDDNTTLDKISIGIEDNEHVELSLNTEVTAINPSDKTIELSSGDTVGYEKLLVATGGEPIRLTEDSKRILSYRTIEDYKKLNDALDNGAQNIIIVGAGFIGTEIAASLAQNEKNVTVIFPETSIQSNKFPNSVSKDLQKLFVENGVRLISGVKAEDFKETDDNVAVKFNDGREIYGDLVITGLGIKPNISLAEDAGLEIIDGGVKVNEKLQTSDENIYAVGDIANFPDKILGRRRVEHEDMANTSGKKAGKIMAGADEEYTRTPMFYSDLFDISFEAIGNIDASLEMIIDKKDDGSFVWYFDGDDVVGVLMWKIHGSIKEAKNILRGDSPNGKDDVRGALDAK